MSPERVLPSETTMGAVTLWVADLENMLGFYRDAVGLEVISEGKSSFSLGGNNVVAVELEHRPEMKYASPGQAGLFHTALVYPTREALANTVHSVARKYPTSFTGSADHLVSQAFYFDDPEGNGVELYWDRDRSQWNWVNGGVQMATLPLDPRGFLSEFAQAEVPSLAKSVGHVHLSVGSIPAAYEFYVTMLGFEKTFQMGDQALFVSAGGYHHHMAMNTWRSRGAGRRQLTLGLADVRIELPHPGEHGEIVERLRHYGQQVSEQDGAVVLDDPWGNRITITTGGVTPASPPSPR